MSVNMPGGCRNDGNILSLYRSILFILCTELYRYNVVLSFQKSDQLAIHATQAETGYRLNLVGYCYGVLNESSIFVTFKSKADA